MSLAGQKRLLFILLPLLFAYGIVVAIYFAVKPQIQNWLLAQADRLSAEKLPITLKIEKMDWTLFFPEIHLEGVQISPKEDLTKKKKSS